MKFSNIIDKMTLFEKARFLSGKSVWETMDYAKYDIPSIFLADGPHGLRKQEGSSDHLGLNRSLEATCFPTAATIANSWSEELSEQIGQCLGREAVAQKVHVILGPGLNIKRSPLCGRNFEYFSEDPYLSGKLAAGYIRGIQSQGPAACPKHFAVNNQELRRMSNDSILDERTYRELYLTGFEIAVKEGKAKTIMSAYNRINGVYANENKTLLLDILRKEWGFDGFVVSDWGGSNDHVSGVKNGSNLEMPTTGVNGAMEIVEGVKNGLLSESDVNDRVDELLGVIFSITKPQEQGASTFDREAHHGIAKQAALESIVLLKNESRILPIKEDRRVAFVGDFFVAPRYQGAGSSMVNPTKLDSVLDLIKLKSNDNCQFARGFERGEEANSKLFEEAVALAKRADIVVYSMGLDEISESEGVDRRHLKVNQQQIQLLEALAAVNSNIVLVLFGGSVIEMPWIQHAKGILHAYLPGQAGAGAILDTLFGLNNPSGKLTETYPLQLSDTPNARYYPGAERTSEYRESLFVGYRYYQTVGKRVQFPFGFGLSYTEFKYSDLKIENDKVSLTISNVGDYDGFEVVQLYVSAPNERIYRPKLELKAFKKVFLMKNESQRIEMQLDEYAFRYYDFKLEYFQVETGNYEILIGASCEDIRLQATHFVDGNSPSDLYDKRELSMYFTGNVTNVDNQTFSKLLGQPIQNGKWDVNQPIEYNDSISQLYYAKGLLARFSYKILNGLMRRSEKKGKPNLNIIFIFNMPFRGIVKMTSGAVSKEMADGLLVIINRGFFAGIGKLIAATIRNFRKPKSERT